jgi:hypothetical protein
MVRRSAGPMNFPFLRAFSLRMQGSQRLCKSRSEHGAGLVEMALSIAVLLSLVLGIMELSLALYTFHFISEAARDGARYAIVRGSSCPAILSGCPTAGTGVDVQTYLQNQGSDQVVHRRFPLATTRETWLRWSSFINFPCQFRLSRLKR